MTTFDEDPDQPNRIENLRAELEKTWRAFHRFFRDFRRSPRRVSEASLEYEKAKPIMLLQLLQKAGLTVRRPTLLTTLGSAQSSGK